MQFLTSDLFKITVPLIAAVIAWLGNERRKRALEEYIRKEEHYKKLLASLRGFYTSTQDRDVKQAFLEQLNQCWLYCPDKVIEAAYAFLGTVAVGAQSDDAAKERACGTLVVAIRKDLLSRRVVKRSRLRPESSRHLQST